MLKITLTILAALTSSVTTKRMNDFECSEDLIIVGFSDEKCQKWAWDLNVGQDTTCRPFPYYAKNDTSIFYRTSCRKENAKWDGVGGMLFHDSSCSKPGQNEKEQYLYYNYTFVKDQDCSKTWNPMENKWIYFNFAKNSTEYQQWRKKSMDDDKKMSTDGQAMRNKDKDDKDDKDDDKDDDQKNFNPAPNTK